MATIRNKATLDSKPFTQGVDRMEAKVAGFSQNVMKLGKTFGVAFGAAALVKFTKDTLDAADAIDNLAKQTDLSNETLQALKFTSEEAGVEFETMRPAINQFRRALEAAKTGSDAQIKAFKTLGISAKEFASMSTEQALMAVGKAMHEGADSAETMQASTLLLGAEATRLRGVLMQLGSEGIDSVKDKLKEMGVIMSDDVVRAADKMQERLDRRFKELQTSGRNFVTQFAVGLQYRVAQLKGEAEGFADEAFGYTSPKVTTKAERDQVKQDRFNAAREAKRAADQEIQALERSLRLQWMTATKKVEALKTDLANAEANEYMAKTEEERVERAKIRVKIQSELLSAEKELTAEKEKLAELNAKIQEFRQGEIQPNERLLQIDQERADLQEQIAKLSSDQIEKRVELGNKVLELSKEEREIQEQIMASMSKLLRMGREGGENIADFFKDFFSGWTGKAEAPAGVDALRRIGGSSLGGVAGRKETREEKLVSLTSNLLKTLQDAKSALIKIEQKAGGGRYR